jgi:hypothetical protein
MGPPWIEYVPRHGGCLFDPAACIALVMTFTRYGKADATRHDDQKNEINCWRDKELSNYLQ